MIIVKRGVRPDEYWKECDCTNCNSTLQFQKKEVEWQYGDPGQRSNAVFNCPVCNEKVYIDTKNIRDIKAPDAGPKPQVWEDKVVSRGPQR